MKLMNRLCSKLMILVKMAIVWVYMAYPGEKPVITGGRRISGWTPWRYGVYKANTHGLQSRQLYVNGQPRIRARTPNEGVILTSSTIGMSQIEPSLCRVQRF